MYLIDTKEGLILLAPSSYLALVRYCTNKDDFLLNFKKFNQRAEKQDTTMKNITSKSIQSSSIRTTCI